MESRNPVKTLTPQKLLKIQDPKTTPHPPCEKQGFQPIDWSIQPGILREGHLNRKKKSIDPFVVARAPVLSSYHLRTCTKVESSRVGVVVPMEGGTKDYLYGKPPEIRTYIRAYIYENIMKTNDWFPFIRPLWNPYVSELWTLSYPNVGK